MNVIYPIRIDSETEETYRLLNHWCRHCGMGRIIRVVNLQNLTGDTSFFCTHCNVAAPGADCFGNSLTCHSLCYCGLDETKCWEGNAIEPKPDGSTLIIKMYNKEVLNNAI
jgi:hypothetical protein